LYIESRRRNHVIPGTDKQQQKVTEELLAPISSLKKAALQFGATLNQMECPLIHIRGNNHLFSCYEIDDHLLAFYTDMRSDLLDSFNTTEADIKMKKNLVPELRILLQNLIS